MKASMRLVPPLLAVAMAACQQVPVLNAASPGQGVVVQGPQEGGWAIRLDLAPAAAAPGFGLLAESGSTDTVPVHRWVAADLVRYDVELRVRNATTATQFDAVGAGLSAQVPVNGQGAGSATFTKLRPGAYYRAHVKAMGRKGGNAGADAIVQLNAQATGDHADFDFTGNNDVAQEASGQVTVRLDGVAFSGQGGVAFGSPLPGGYASPTGALGIQPILPPSPSPSPSAGAALVPTFVQAYAAGPNAYQVAAGPAGDVWVTSSNHFTHLSSTGSQLGSVGLGGIPKGVGVGADGQAWAVTENSGQTHLNRLSSTASVLSSTTFPGVPYSVTVDAQGQVWVGASQYVVRCSSAGTVLGSVQAVTAGNAEWVDAAPDGSIWAVSNTRVIRLSSVGAVLASLSFEGNNDNLVQVKVAPNGVAWVVDSNRNLVHRLTSNLTVLSSHAVGITSPLGVAVEPNSGEVWVSGYDASVALVRLSSLGAVLSTHAHGDGVGLVSASANQVWVSNLADPGQVFLYRYQ